MGGGRVEEEKTYLDAVGFGWEVDALFFGGGDDEVEEEEACTYEGKGEIDHDQR